MEKSESWTVLIPATTCSNILNSSWQENIWNPKYSQMVISLPCKVATRVTHLTPPTWAEGPQEQQAQEKNHHAGASHECSCHRPIKGGGGGGTVAKAASVYHTPRWTPRPWTRPINFERRCWWFLEALEPRDRMKKVCFNWWELKAITFKLTLIQACLHPQIPKCCLTLTAGQLVFAHINTERGGRPAHSRDESHWKSNGKCCKSSSHKHFTRTILVKQKSSWDFNSSRVFLLLKVIVLPFELDKYLGTTHNTPDTQVPELCRFRGCFCLTFSTKKTAESRIRNFSHNF